MKENIWEEENLIKPKPNLENNLIPAPSDTTNDIKMNVIENQWNDIGSEKKWTRVCPECGKEMVYKTERFLTTSIKNNSWCNVCRVLERRLKSEKEKLIKYNNNFSKNCPKCNKKQTYSSLESLRIAIKKNTICNPCRGKTKRITIPENGWVKNCPKCNKLQKYSRKSSFTDAVRKNKVCGKCKDNPRKIVVPENGWKRTCGSCGKEIVYFCKKSFVSCEKVNALCRSCATIKSAKTKDMSVFRSEEFRNRFSEMMKKKRQTESYGELFREKCRINKLKQIQQQGVSRTYNENACKFIDKINEKLKFNFQHALNGGEINVSGFSLDGYDKEKNIVFEYDEPKHNKKCQIEKDKYRQQIILNKLKPSMFLMFNEEYNKLVDVVSGKEIT